MSITTATHHYHDMEVILFNIIAIFATAQIPFTVDVKAFSRLHEEVRQKHSDDDSAA